MISRFDLTSLKDRSGVRVWKGHDRAAQDRLLEDDQQSSFKSEIGVSHQCRFGAGDPIVREGSMKIPRLSDSGTFQNPLRGAAAPARC
jgi:hypothetical protein